MVQSKNVFLLVAGSLALVACEQGATCAALEEYSFSVEPSTVEVSAGHSYELNATFFPIPNRRMRFSDNTQRHISVRSDSIGWEHVGVNQETLPDDKVDVIEIGPDKPLRFKIKFQVKQGGNGLNLDFVDAGELRNVPTGEVIPLQIALLPMSACIADSNDIFALTDLEIDTR